MLLEEILNNFKEHSNDIAYESVNKKITYNQLFEKVVKFYNFILKNTNLNNIIVYGHKQDTMIAIFLACSFAGKTYIPIDIYTPLDRVQRIISSVKPAMVFDLCDKLKTSLDNIVSSDEIERIINDKIIADKIVPKMKNEDVYYMIFTSGTTGIPKGVKVTYKNLNSFVNWFKNIITDKKTTVLNQASFSFDLSVADIYLALSTGSKLVVLYKDMQMNFPKMFDFLNKSNIEVAVMTPSFAELLLINKKFNNILLPKLKTIYFCGETLSVNIVKQIFDRFGNIKIINSYGPTECTVAVTSVEITDELLQKDTLPIGITKPGTQILILDEKLKQVRENEKGQIVIIGDSVSKGYFNKSSQDNNFIKYNGKRAYLTGDIGHYENGMIWYDCRKDRQIKYRGYRIELSDIEKNLYRLKYVNKVVVLPDKSDNGKVKGIIAFIKTEKSYKKEEKDIKKDLLEFIPSYMCPKIKFIDKIELNNNGKCDIEKLKELSYER